MCSSKTPFLVLAVVLAALGVAAQPPDPSPEAQAWVERLRAHRLAKAEPVTFATPYYSLVDGDAVLFLQGRFPDPIDVEITAWSPSGETYPLGLLTLEPTTHEEISLAEALTDAPESFATGSLTVDLVGDVDMFQGWLVLQQAEGQVTEIPLQKVGGSSAWRWFSFWDARQLPSSESVRAQYHLANFGLTPISVRVERQEADGRSGFEVVSLRPGESRTIVGSVEDSASGAIRFELPRNRRDVLVTGFLTGEDFESRLPVVGEADLALPTELQSIRVPLKTSREDAPPAPMDAWVSLYNGTEQATAVEVDLLGQLTGERLAGRALTLNPGEITTVSVFELTSDAFPLGSPEEVRLRVRSDPMGIMVSAVSLDPSGVPFEVAFFHRRDAHPTGGYPLPSLEGRSVFTTLINLGEEPSRVGLQYFWEEGGTYAYGPVEIPAGGSIRLDVAALAESGEEDLLHRSLAADFEKGFLQWSARHGSRELIARTEVRERYSNDAFGFNCTTCCSEAPFGELTPSSALFPAGGNQGFAATEMVSTCTGTLGPYAVSNPTLTYSSPLSWDASTVASAHSTDQTARFDALAESIDLSCNTRQVDIFDEGPVEVIDADITEVSLPQDEIKVRLSPVGSGLSGNLRVWLSGLSGTRTLFEGPASAGTQLVSFGSLGSYGAGEEFTTVNAQWTVSNQVATTNTTYRFRALGSYEHTRYNTPDETQCTGVGVPICTFDGTGSNPCTNVASCTAGSATARSQWVTEVQENGGGQHSTLGLMTLEKFCSLDPFCSEKMRTVTAPCGQCGLNVTANSTVAMQHGHEILTCGAQVFIDGIGVRTVTDTGDLAANQLDHYYGVTGCNDAPSIGPRLTFQLF